MLAGPRGAPAADRVLVPLDAVAADRWLARITGALLDLAGGRYRQGIEVLQAALVEGEPKDPNAVLFLVPETLPRDPAALARTLAELAGAKAPEPAGGGDDEDGDERPPPRAAAGPADGRRFLPLSAVARAALSALPAEGLRAYRELYDDVARAILAGEPAEGGPVPIERMEEEALLRVARGFFWTRDGDEAAEVLGDALFERGAARAAIEWWKRVLDEYPDSDVPRGRLQAKVLSALRLLGEKEWYDLERSRVLEGAAAEPSGGFAAIEAAPLQSRGERPPAPGASRWGGEVGFHRPPDLFPWAGGEAPFGEPGGGLGAAPLFAFSWDSWIWSRKGLPGTSEPGRPRMSIADVSTSLQPFVPLLDGESVYVSGVFSLYRLNARAGAGSVLREYRKPVPPDMADYRELGESCLYTTTIWKRGKGAPAVPAGMPDDLLVTSYVSDRVKLGRFMTYDITVEIPIRSLVAFASSSKDVLWKTAKERAIAGPLAGGEGGVGVADLPDEEAEEFEGIRPGFFPHRGFRYFEGTPVQDSRKDFSYTSPVVVKNGIVAAAGWVQRGYVRGAVRGLDAATGALLWETALASSQMELTMFGEIAREPFAGAIAESDGVLYCLTQTGVIGAVEIETGRIRWLTTYDTIEVEPSTHRTAIKRSISWGPNPLLLIGNVLIATPRDSEYLYAISTGRGPEGPLSGGKVLWRYYNPFRHGQQGGDLRDLLGYYRGNLYFTGAEGVSALDLSGMDAEGRLPRGLSQPPRVQGNTFEGVAGPGALTASGVVFSDREGVRLVSLDLRNVIDLTPRPYRHSVFGDYPGRVQVAPGAILMTSRQMVSCYTPGPPGPGR
jgi:outer membrane protein assembly factor BamB